MILHGTQARAETPWGVSDTKHKIADGITFYGTPSHGGFHISEGRFDSMPEPLKQFKTKYAPPLWYEEDCDWNIVVLAFPEYFSAEQFKTAKLQAIAMADYMPTVADYAKTL